MDEQSEGEPVLTVRVVLYMCVWFSASDCHGALKQDQVALCVQLYQCVFVFSPLVLFYRRVK